MKFTEMYEQKTKKENLDESVLSRLVDFFGPSGMIQEIVQKAVEQAEETLLDEFPEKKDIIKPLVDDLYKAKNFTELGKKMKDVKRKLEYMKKEGKI